MIRGNNINRFLRGCSDHRDQLFCLFELKKPASLALRMESRLEKIFSMGINIMSKLRSKDRFNEHRRTIDNPNNKSKPTTAAEHFLSSLNHVAKMPLVTKLFFIYSDCSRMYW